MALRRAAPPPRMDRLRRGAPRRSSASSSCSRRSDPRGGLWCPGLGPRLHAQGTQLVASGAVGQGDQGDSVSLLRQRQHGHRRWVGRQQRGWGRVGLDEERRNAKVPRETASLGRSESPAFRQGRGSRRCAVQIRRNDLGTSVATEVGRAEPLVWTPTNVECRPRRCEAAVAVAEEDRNLILIPRCRWSGPRCRRRRSPQLPRRTDGVGCGPGSGRTARA